MYALLSVVSVCITLIILVHDLQNKPVTVIVHKKFETIPEPKKELTTEEKKLLEDQSEFVDGISEVIKVAQEFLGGDIDAEPKRKAE